MSPPPADGTRFPDGDLDKLAKQIEKAAREAYADFLRLVDGGMPPRDAIERVSEGFEGKYYRQLSEAFSRVLAEPWTVKAMAAYPVGPVTLSRRMYEHWRVTESEVTGIIARHAQGMQQARELALQLYEGYGYRGVEPLKVQTGQFRTLPKPLRALATEPAVRATLMRTARRAAATRLRTAALRSAYTQAFDAAIEGAARPRLERLLKVAVEEKSRYFANRIAQTELARAHSERSAAELLADSTIEVVQWRLSAAHPRPDICDIFAEVDMYGLGPGVYPKLRAPKPIAHPFCRCRLRSRPDLRAADAKERPAAEREYLAAMGEERAARLLGSKARLRKVMGGASARDAWNGPVDERFKVRLLGEPTSTQAPKPPPPPAVAPPAPPVAPAGPPVAPAAPPPAPLPAMPASVIAAFQEQATAVKVAAYVMRENLADFADFKGVHVAVANEWARSLYEHVREFPDLRPAQKFTGTGQAQLARWAEIERGRYVQKLIALGYSRPEAERIAKQRVRTRKMHGNTYAHSTTQPDVGGVAINSKWGKDPVALEAALARDVSTGWHPPGSDRIRSVVDHELGHQLDALLGLSRDPEIIALYRSTDVGKEVSRYGQTNIAEFIAEAWAESKNNPNPRPVAVRVAEIIRQRHRARRAAARP